MSLTLTWAEACARRLDRHGLLRPAAADQLEQQVGVMCGAHAQVMSAAELSIGLRVAGTTAAAVRAALWTRHSLVKAFGPRGTVHLFPAQDLAMWTGVLAAIPPGSSGQPPAVRLTADQTDSVVAAIDAALAAAELTLDELTEAIVARTGAWAGEPSMLAFGGLWPRWRQALGTAARRGAICFGPNRGRNVTYTSPRRWLPGFQPADPATASAEVLQRYLYAYGPATPQQFAQWLGAPRAWAANLFATLAGELTPVSLEGVEAWLAPGDTLTPAAPPSGVRLLPYFDAYTVGCHPREKVFPGSAAERALAHGQAGNFPVLLINGIAAGVWHQRRTGRRLAVTVEPFFPLTAAQRRELEQQIERIGEILDAQPQLTIGSVTTGPHA